MAPNQQNYNSVFLLELFQHENVIFEDTNSIQVFSYTTNLQSMISQPLKKTRKKSKKKPNQAELITIFLMHLVQIV